MKFLWLIMFPVICTPLMSKSSDKSEINVLSIAGIYDNINEGVSILILEKDRRYTVTVSKSNTVTSEGKWFLGKNSIVLIDCGKSNCKSQGGVYLPIELKNGRVYVYTDPDGRSGYISRNIYK
ncbi:hypothetical protein [Deinococcus sp. QL22]|uniref:hypothetical protein n=1 Tax=Deinococcus sp. QL22 TaxID=2939437 RepID=UPI0020181326|nr:hypothetical protein [Deinococcus sp. QL22]UQN10593.1 hypothetical protein M1R55_30825 [Deinococcus sp. QL22]